MLPMYIRRMNLTFRQIDACKHWFLSGARTNLNQACPMSNCARKFAPAGVRANSSVSKALFLAVSCVKSAEKGLADPILFQLTCSISVVALQLVISQTLFTDYCNESSFEAFGVAVFWLIISCVNLASITFPLARVNSCLHGLAK